jgi:hypothetical protein
VINLQGRYIIEAPHSTSFQPPIESGLPPEQNQALPDNSYYHFQTKLSLIVNTSLILQLPSWSKSTNYYEAMGDTELFRSFQWVGAVNTIVNTRTRCW